MDSSTIAVTSISHFLNALDKEFTDIQATIQYEFTLKCKCDMIITYSHMNRKGKHSQHSSIIWPICLNGLVFFDKLSHCVKNVGIRSYSGTYFPAFGLNMERYSVSLRIQSECRKIRAKITPNTDTFQAVSSCRLESCCIHLNIRFCTCFEQSVSWESLNYRTSIHSEMHTWHDENNSQMYHGYMY